MTQSRCKLTKREIEIVRRFKDEGYTVENLALNEWCTSMKGRQVLTCRSYIEAVLRKALIHQRITPHGKVYYDKPRRKR